MDKITDVITDRHILNDFLNLTHDEFTVVYPEVSIITYFNTVVELLSRMNQEIIMEDKKITDIDGQWILDRCLFNGIHPSFLFKICS
ncbi:MAG: hypothetical protein J6S67_02000 [Methanobrevibacter sp.]|nr:hypothetical protein [Methanobrevibacter sp.]